MGACSKGSRTANARAVDDILAKVTWMPVARLAELHLGKVDGKHEFVDSAHSRLFFDGFLVPETIQLDDFLNGHKYVLRGFRGTGKTSLLRYLAKLLRDKGAQGKLILFKSGLSEAQRIEISRQAGLSLEEVDSGKIEVQQDFKDAWRWFLHRKLGEMILARFIRHSCAATVFRQRA